jgi:hypothetical protein
MNPGDLVTGRSLVMLKKIVCLTLAGVKEEKVELSDILGAPQAASSDDACPAL